MVHVKLTFIILKNDHGNYNNHLVIRKLSFCTTAVD